MSCERIVIDDPWRPMDERGEALRAESRNALDRRRRRALMTDLLVLVPVTLACALAVDDLLAAAVALGYFFVFECLTGQTIGKRRMGLRVVRLDGRPLTIASVATRNVLLLVDAVGFYLVGYITMLLSRRRQRLGDLFAGTVVTDADLHPHVPAAERGRAAMLVGYPLVWFATALVVVALVGRSDANDRYAADAARLCQTMRSQPTAGVEGLRRAGLATADLQRALSMMTPPAGLRAAHERLVRAEGEMSSELMYAAGAIRTSDDPAGTAERLAAQFDAEREQNARALQGLGLEACL